DVLAATGTSLRNTQAGLAVARPAARRALPVGRDELVAGDVLVVRRRPDAAEELGKLALGFPDRERAYLAGSVTAMRLAGGIAGSERSGLVLDLVGARLAAERLLADRAAQRE